MIVSIDLRQTRSHETNGMAIGEFEDEVGLCLVEFSLFCCSSTKIKSKENNNLSLLWLDTILLDLPHHN